MKLLEALALVLCAVIVVILTAPRLRISWARMTLRWVLGVGFVAAGFNHFIAPRFYLAIMPPGLPWPLELVYVSGVAEIMGGIGVLVPPTRRVAGWGLIALLIAVFPANLYAAFHGVGAVPKWILWARLPLQFVFIAWVYWTCLSHIPARTAMTKAS